MAAVLLAAGCSDGGPTVAPLDGETTALGAPIRCEAVPAQGRITCAGGGPGPTEGPPAAAGSLPPPGSTVIAGGQGELLLLEWGQAAFDPQEALLAADLTVRSLLPGLFGSPDGFAVTGLKAFLHEGPAVTAGSGAVTLRSADGTGRFTADGQPFVAYHEILDPGVVSAERRWEWRVGAAVETFTFELMVEGRVGEAPPLPATGFEERGGAGWTTHGEELAFLGQVAGASPRIAVAEVDRSVQGRPIHLAWAGYPQAPSEEEIAAGRSVLVIGVQHGNEPAGREMALQLLRDLAYTRDRELLEQLASLTVAFIPTANPDGREANTRANASSVDVNRDHLHLATPEGRVIGRVLRDLAPDIVVDAHERTGAGSPDMQLLWPRNLNVHAPVRELSRELIEDHVWPEMEAEGFSVGLYGPGAGAPGDENERILRNAAGLRHSLSMLTESAGQQAPPARVAAQMEAARAVLRFHRARLADVAAAVDEAPGRKAEAGLAANEPFYLFGADNDPPSAADVLDPPPCGYLVGAGEAQALAARCSCPWASPS